MPKELQYTTITHHADHSHPHPLALSQWGMDILGLFLQASGQCKFLLIAMDYFTKWIEAESLARMIEARMVDFVWKSIVCRFDLPQVLITDNGRQFTGAKFEEFCEEHGIAYHLTSIAHR